MMNFLTYRKSESLILHLWFQLFDSILRIFKSGFFFINDELFEKKKKESFSFSPKETLASANCNYTYHAFKENPADLDDFYGGRIPDENYAPDDFHDPLKDEWPVFSLNDSSIQVVCIRISNF